MDFKASDVGRKSPAGFQSWSSESSRAIIRTAPIRIGTLLAKALEDLDSPVKISKIDHQNENHLGEIFIF